MTARRPRTAFLSSYRLMQAALPPVLLVLPALIGVFWGAPLVARELETGTFRLAWTQGVTRQRWLAVKLTLAGLASMAVAGLLSLILTWWFSPIDRVQLNQLTPAMFGVRGITPIGYAAFAFALGVTAGAFIRRTIPAMAATIVVFTGVRLAFTSGCGLTSSRRCGSPRRSSCPQKAGRRRPRARARSSPAT